MKKLTALFLSTLMVLTLVISMATFAVSASTTITADKTWYDEAQTEFTITTPAQLLGFAELLNEDKTFEGKTVKLGNDITLNEGFDGNKPTDASNLIKWPIAPKKEFHGTLDGQNHAIIGLYAPSEMVTDNNYGVFGNNTVAPAKTTTIKNLAIIKSYMEVKTNRNGALLGGIYSGNVNISNCYMDVNMSAPNGSTHSYGSMIGYVKNADSVVNVSNCVVAGDINIENAMTGGFIGHVEKCSEVNITNCAMYGTVTGSSNSNGAIIGRITEGKVVFDNCICAGGANNITGAFYTAASAMVAGTHIELKNSLYTLVYPKAFGTSKAHSAPEIDGSILIEGANALIGTAATEVLTTNELTEWDAVDGYYALPKAMSSMVNALQLPTITPSEGEEDGDIGGNTTTTTPDGDDDETDTPDTEESDTEAATTAADEAQTTADEKDGCGSIVGGGIALVAVASIGSCVFVTKKKD